MAILRNVPKTFTFEEQRVEINEVAQDLYDLSLEEAKDIELGDLNVTVAVASGGGNLTYTVTGTYPNDTGEFLYTPPDLSSYWVEDTAKIAKWDEAWGWGDHSTEGYLKNINGLSINELQDVTITSVQPDQFLRYENGKWINTGDLKLSVTKANAGTPDLTVSGTVFTYTPPDLSAYSAKVTTDDNAPATPHDGQLWWKSDEGNLKIYYEDADSSQWVDAVPAGIQLPDLSVAPQTPAQNSSLTYDNTTGVFSYTPSSGGGEINVQANWTELDTTNDAFIKNKPTIPVNIGDLQNVDTSSITDGYVLTYVAASGSGTWEPKSASSATSQVQSDWTQAVTTDPSYIKNKPTQFADWNAVGTPAEIGNKPTIPAPQIQSDWTQTTQSSLDYIKNKPSVAENLSELSDTTIPGSITTGHVLKWSGTTWAPATDASSGSSASLVSVPVIDQTATTSGATFTGTTQVSFPSTGADHFVDLKFEKFDNNKVYEFKINYGNQDPNNYHGWYIADKQTTRIDGGTTYSNLYKISNELPAGENWKCYDRTNNNEYLVRNHNWLWPNNGQEWTPSTDNLSAIGTWHFVIDMPRRKIWLREYDESWENGLDMGRWWRYQSGGASIYETWQVDPMDPMSKPTIFIPDFGTGEFFFSVGMAIPQTGAGNIIVEPVPEQFSAFRKVMLGNGLALADLSVLKPNPTPNGSGDVTYNNTSGVFTYTPPDLSGFLSSEVDTLDSVTSRANGNTTANSITSGGNGTTGGVTLSDGLVSIRTGTGNVAAIDLYCETTNAHKISIKAPAHANFGGNQTFVLPGTAGANTNVLTTDGAGNTSWTNQIDTNIFKDLTGTPSAYDNGKYLRSTVNGTEWATIPGVSTASVATDDTAPTTPVDGDLWWDSQVGNLKVYYEDVDSSQWVDAVNVTASDLSNTLTTTFGQQSFPRFNWDKLTLYSNTLSGNQRYGVYRSANKTNRTGADLSTIFDGDSTTFVKITDHETNLHASNGSSQSTFGLVFDTPVEDIIEIRFGMDGWGMPGFNGVGLTGAIWNGTTSAGKQSETGSRLGRIDAPYAGLTGSAQEVIIYEGTAMAVDYLMFTAFDDPSTPNPANYGNWSTGTAGDFITNLYYIKMQKSNGELIELTYNKNEDPSALDEYCLDQWTIYGNMGTFNQSLEPFSSNNTHDRRVKRTEFPFELVGGKGMSVDANGEWTFPSPGVWKLDLNIPFMSGGSSSQVGAYLQYTDGGSWHWIAKAESVCSGASNIEFCRINYTLNIKDVTKQKIRIYSSSSADCYHPSDSNNSNFVAGVTGGGDWLNLTFEKVQRVNMSY